MTSMLKIIPRKEGGKNTKKRKTTIKYIYG